MTPIKMSIYASIFKEIRHQNKGIHEYLLLQMKKWQKADLSELSKDKRIGDSVRVISTISPNRIQNRVMNVLSVCDSYITL
jgi:hypothetical protein